MVFKENKKNIIIKIIYKLINIKKDSKEED
jgi:hypothetical protein